MFARRDNGSSHARAQGVQNAVDSGDGHAMVFVPLIPRDLRLMHAQTLSQLPLAHYVA